MTSPLALLSHSLEVTSQFQQPFMKLYLLWCWKIKPKRKTKVSIRVLWPEGKVYRKPIPDKKLVDRNNSSAIATKSFTQSNSTISTTAHKKSTTVLEIVLAMMLKNQQPSLKNKTSKKNESVSSSAFHEVKRKEKCIENPCLIKSFSIQITSPLAL